MPIPSILPQNPATNKMESVAIEAHSADRIDREAGFSASHLTGFSHTR